MHELATGEGWSWYVIAHGDVSFFVSERSIPKVLALCQGEGSPGLALDLFCCMQPRSWWCSCVTLTTASGMVLPMPEQIYLAHPASCFPGVKRRRNFLGNA